MEFKKIIFSKDHGIATLEMNWIKNYNAIDEQMAAELLAGLEEATADDVKVVVIKGQEKCFSAGGDIAYFYDKVQADDIGEFDIVQTVFKVSQAIRQLPKPVIASCSGAVAGAGCNLALSCDFIVCAENVKFIQAFVHLGLVPDTGGVFLLAKSIGWRRATELVMTGRPLKAQEGKDIGLFYDVVPPEALAERTLQLAEQLSRGPSLAYAKMKEMMYEAVFKDYLTYGKVECDAQKICGHSEDFKEGVTAFMEKRPAVFKGR